MNREQLAWAAGFYEGEGSFFCSGKKYIRLYMVVAQSDPEVLERFQEAVGLGRIEGPFEKTGCKPVWRWIADSFQPAQATLAMLWGFLGPVKQTQAAKAIDLYNQRRKDAGTWVRGSGLCRNGHPMTEENAYWWNGKRYCLPCRVEYGARRDPERRRAQARARYAKAAR